MALFKILKGQGANLPSGKVEGYAYVTTDTHKFYVDISASERIELNAFAADRLSSLGTAHQALVGKASDDAISANPVWRDVSPSMNITNGTAAGPTIKITVLGEDSLATAFPTATVARSGVVNVGDQVFFGNKKFQMKDTIELRTGDKPYWINKNLDWEATSYKRWVILLVPELTATNQVVNNFIEGKFCFYKSGSNLFDAVDLTLNVCYNQIKYYLQNFGDNTFNLCRVTYNNINYIALNVGYQSNPYSSVSFTGHVYSTLDGGNEGANFPLNLPFAVNYRTEANGNNAEVINNADVNSSITDTLTTTLITNVTRYRLKFYADGANITNLNASNLENGTVPLERLPGIPTSKITSGILPVARGGTGVGSWIVNQVVLTNASDGTGAFASRGYKDSTSAEAIGTTSDFVTERDVYYGLPKINNSHAYTSTIGIYAPNGHGNASSALMGNDSDAAPTWVAVAPSAAFATGTESAGPSLTITVLGLTSTGVVVPKGSKDVYGVLRLTEGYTSTDGNLAATGKSILAAIKTLKVDSVGGAGKYISAISETDGKISATVTDTSVANSWADGTTSAGPSLTTTVNGVAATAAVMPKGSTSKHGALMLTSTYTNTDETLAMNGKAVKAAIGTLSATAVGGGTGEYISKISEANGIISATKATTTVSNSWTAGTTAGPVLKTKVNGIEGTGVAIPSAANDASGIVTTGAQTFAGNKTFNGAIYANNGLHWKAGTNFACDGVTANNQEWSFDLTSGDYTGTYWHVWSGKNSASILACYNDDRRVTMPGDLASTSTTTGTLRVTGGIGATGQVTALRLAANGSNTSYSLYINGTSYLNGNTRINGHLYFEAGKSLYMNYNSTDYCILRTFNNGNIGLQAASSGLYIGYDNTLETHMYYSSGTARTEFLQINNNGAYALTRFGVNGQNTAYTLHVNGTTNALAYTLNGATSAGTNYITGSAGRIFFGGNFHIDSLGTNATYINYYTANNVYLCAGSSQGKVGIGTTSPGSKLEISGGLLKITYNSNTVTIGSQNTSWCHIYNSADIPFIFNKAVYSTSKFQIYDTSTSLSNNNLTFASGGGWSMSDTTWIRTVGSKSVYMNAGTFRCDGTIQAGSSGTFKWTNAGDITIHSATTNGWDGSYLKAVGATVTTGLHVGSGGTNRGVYDFTASVWTIYHNGSYVYCGTRLYSAVWNDFAEYREGETTEGGRAVYDDGFGKMRITTKRLQPGSRLTSDTFGISVGESDTAKTPIGVGGRVLAYPYRDRNEYHVGDAVCAAPGGTIDIMTREEIMMYPERILGTVSEIPTYETWAPNFKQEQVEGSGAQRKVEVKGRIWVYVR